MGEFERNHYVQSAYIKSWIDKENKKLWLNNKTTTAFKHKKPEKVLFEKNLYIKTIKDILILKPDDLQKIFYVLKDLKIEHKGKTLNNDIDYLKHYDNYDEWDIKNVDGNSTNKDDIKKKIEDVRIVNIEQDFSVVENYWPDLKNEIINYVNKTNNEFKNSSKEKLIKYIFFQMFRTLSFKKTISEALNAINVFDDATNECSTDLYHKRLMELFQKDILPGKYEDLKIYMDKFDVEFHTVINNKYIHTSDTPVISLNDSCFSGVYFPITPKILCRLYQGNRDKTQIHSMREKTTREFNKRMKEEAKQYYISSYEIK